MLAAASSRLIRRSEHVGLIDPSRRRPGIVSITATVGPYLSVCGQPTSLYNTLIILVLLFGGLGLIFRSLRAAA